VQSTGRNPDTNKLRNAIPSTTCYTSASRNDNFIGTHVQDPRGSIMAKNHFPNTSEKPWKYLQSPIHFSRMSKQEYPISSRKFVVQCARPLHTYTGRPLHFYKLGHFNNIIYFILIYSRASLLKAMKTIIEILFPRLFFPCHVHSHSTTDFEVLKYKFHI